MRFVITIYAKSISNALMSVTTLFNAPVYLIEIYIDFVFGDILCYESETQMIGVIRIAFYIVQSSQR